MQAFVVAAQCKRFFLIFGMVMVLGSAVLAQTGQIPSDPPAATGSVASPPAAPATGQTAAVGASATKAETSLPAPPAGWAELAFPMIKTVGGFGLVLSMILVGFMLFRKYAPQYMGKRTQERFLRLIETLPMGEKRSIVLVQAGARKLLLASTAGQITLLTSLADVAGPASLNVGDAAENDSAAASLGNFRNLYEMEKKVSPVRPAIRPTLPPDIRGKMQELRKALEG